MKKLGIILFTGLILVCCTMQLTYAQTIRSEAKCCVFNTTELIRGRISQSSAGRHTPRFTCVRRGRRRTFIECADMLHLGHHSDGRQRYV